METKNEKKQEQSTREYSDELKQELVKRAVERENDMRGDYFRDYTAILHSRPFRRLKHKTQVFFDPKDDHICTRMEHVLQVASIAKTICMGLKKKNHDWNFLDEDLAYAIALGHDLGHAPFGHTGEKELNALLGRNEKFMHEINSYRVVSRIAGEHEHGLNLTYAVKDGIICHCGEKFEPEMAPTKEIKNLEKISDRENYPTTYEGCIVRFSDKIAYLGRDLEDTIAAGFFGEKGCNLPNDKITEKLRECLKEKVGKNKILKSELEQINRNVIDYFVKDIVKNSYKEDKIRLSTEAYETMKVLIEFCRIHIFVHPRIEEYKRYCKKSMKILFDYLVEIYDYYAWQSGSDMPGNGLMIDRVLKNYLLAMKSSYFKEKEEKNWSIEDLKKQVMADFISGMTDRFAADSVREICVPPALPIYS